MINKNLLKELANTYEISLIEQHLVYYYIVSNNIEYQKSKILADYLNNFEEHVNLFFDISSLQIKSIKELENYLELLIPENDRKLNGAFFTPIYIIDFIIHYIKPQTNHKNIDPSCGSGAFLIALAEYYKNEWGKSVKETVKQNIFGADILNFNIVRAKILLSLFAMQNNEILEEIDFNLSTVDSLRKNWDQKFDNVIGNPPYVKFQDLSPENRIYLINNYDSIKQGTFNLYFAFFELGFRLLKENGKLGYITPNNYFTSLAAEPLRIYLTNSKCVERVVDFNHKKVFDVQTYTAITFLSKKNNEIIIYDRIKEQQSPDEFLIYANGSPNKLINLNVKKWRLLKSDEQENISKIEAIGTPLKSLFNIYVGIATLKDEIYFVDGERKHNNYLTKLTESGEFKIEYQITRSVYKISDFKNQNEISSNTKRIICPYTIKNGVAESIPEKEFRRYYPKTYEYLLSVKDILSSRDKGKFNFDPFYSWGRTQGLTKTGIKILTPTFSKYPRFLLVKDKEAFFTNGYGIYFKNELDNDLFKESINPLSKIENVDSLLKILNSIVMHYYVTKTSVAIEGGYPCYQKNFIEKFTIPSFSDNELQTIRSLTIKSDIDEFLINKYQLKFLVPNLSL
jgi:type I restriction-modification system DNA methylase subunit